MSACDTPEDLLARLAIEVKHLRAQAESWFNKHEALRSALEDVAPLASKHFGNCVVCGNAHGAQTGPGSCPIGRTIAALADLNGGEE